VSKLTVDCCGVAWWLCCLSIGLGGKSPLELGECEIEKGLWEHVERVMKENNMEFLQYDKEALQSQENNSWWW